MDDQTKQTEPKPRAVATREPLIAQGNTPLAIVPTTFEQVWRLAQVAAAAGTVKSPEQGSMIIMHGLEVGMSPMMALERIAIINGRKCIWGDGVPALPIAQGLVEDWHEEITGTGDEMIATCSVKRKGQKSWVIRTFSVTDAKEAGLWQTEAVVKRRGRDGNVYETKNDSPWYKYRKRMLAMRARIAFRDAFPDVYSGLHIAEEMQGEHPMRDVTPRETFRRVENPLADLPPEQAEELGPIGRSIVAQAETEAAERKAESQNELSEAVGHMRPTGHPGLFVDEPFDPETGEITATETGNAAGDSGGGGTSVAANQQPPEARREPAGELSRPDLATQRLERETAQATALRDLAAKADARAPETFPLEVAPNPSGTTGGTPASAAPPVATGTPQAATGTQSKVTGPAPVADGNGFLPEALAIVANAIDAGKLNRWWRETRKQRTEAGLAAAQLDQLTQAYNRKFIQLSET